MTLKNLAAVFLYVLSCLIFTTSVLAGTLTGNIRVDDEFRLYISTDDNQQGDLLLSGNSWNSVFAVTTQLTDGQTYYLHVYGKDRGGVAGLLGEFNLAGGYHSFSNNSSHIVSNTSNWKVSKSGWGNYVTATDSNGQNGTSSQQIAADATWIWSSDPSNDKEVYFSLKITGHATPVAGELNGKIRVDDRFSAYLSTDDNVQGNLLVSGTSWQSTYSLNAQLIEGQNYYLHIYATDLQDIAAFLGEFNLTGSDHLFSNGQNHILTNPSDWKVSKTGWSNYANASVVNGKNGVDPWGNNPQISTNADWIWTSNANNDNQAYFSVEIVSQSSNASQSLSGYLTGDNSIDVYLSTDDSIAGAYLGSGNDWQTTYALTKDLLEGQNYYLHIQAQDTGGIAGFIGDFTLTGNDHVFPNNQKTISTNTTDWKVSKSGWSNYLNASMVNGNNGVAPWGTRPNISSGATWIWSSDAQNDNQVYLSLAITSQSSSTLAFYKFEEQSWSGTGSVKDSSDNSHHGSPIGSIEPLLPTDKQKSCKAMDVGYNSSFFYTEALNTRFDVDQDIGKAGTVSFWYRSKVSWTSSFSRQLLDASNGFFFLFGKSFYLTLYSGKLEFGMEDSADNDAVVRASGLNFPADEWVHVAITWDLQVDKMAIYVNGVAVASTSNAGLNGQMANLNSLYVGDSRDLYFTGNSTDNSAYGQFDDLRIYNVAQDSGAIATDANTLSPCLTDEVDHFRLEHDIQGFTCETESIIVKACKDASCTQLYDQPTSISLAPGTWSGGNTLNFTGSINASLSITTPGVYALSKTAASESADLRCFFGSTETCEIEFVDAGFEFIGATVNDKALPDQLAETQFNNVQLRSVQDNDGVCQAALTGNQTVTLGYNCDSPESCLTSLAGIEISNPDGENTGDFTLNFSAAGIASLATLNYADAGRLVLSAQANIDGAKLIKGSALVDVYPANLRLSVTPSALEYTGAEDTSTFIAGESFEFKIGAYGAVGSLLPNYQPSQMQLKVKRTYPNQAGTVDGTFRYANTAELGSSAEANFFIDINNLTFTGGEYSYAGAYYDEVGRIAIDVQDFNYLGNKISSQSELPLGSFVPAYYSVDVESPYPALQNVQLVFSYVGQTIPFESFPAMRVTAKNALDQTTNNHDSSDWTLRPTLADVNNALKLSYMDKSVYSGDATVFKGNAPLITDDNNYDGSVVITVPDATIVYNKTDVNHTMFTPVDPFSALFDIVFHAAFLTDLDGLCFRDNYVDTSCNELTFADVTGADLRYGRFALKSTYGPENETLRPEFAVEYFNNGQWLVNTLDNETTIDFSESASQLLLSKKGVGNDLTGSFDPVISDGTVLLGVPDDKNDFELSAPGQAGEVYLRLNPAVDPSGWPQYLNYDWSGDGKICNEVGLCVNGNGVDYPQAVLSFGLFRGNDRVIQWREVFN